MLSLDHLRGDALFAVLLITALAIASLRVFEWLANKHVEHACEPLLKRADSYFRRDETRKGNGERP